METEIKEAKAGSDDGELTKEEKSFLEMIDEGRPAPLEPLEDEAVPVGTDDRSDTSGPKERRRSWLRLALSLILLVAVIAGVYFIFPKHHVVRKPITHLSSVEALPQELVTDPVYGESVKEAFASYISGDFTGCVMKLRPLLDNIFDDHLTNRNASDALGLYLHSVRIANVGYDIRREAKELLRKLAQQEPDRLLWHLELIHIDYNDILDYKRVFEHAGKRIVEWQYLLDRCNTVLMECRDLEKIQRQRIAVVSDDFKPLFRHELAELLAIESAIYTTKWILEGGKGRDKLPDDEGDPGVSSRENALMIALYDDKDCKKAKKSMREFYEIRNFIAETVKSQANGMFNSYYWNGTKYSRITPLQREINNTAATLRRMK